jgi:hypothetical protein
MGLGSRIRKKTYSGARGSKSPDQRNPFKKPADALRSKQWARLKAQSISWDRHLSSTEGIRLNSVQLSLESEKT